MRKLTTKEFIEKAVKIHGDKYNYSKVEYENNSTKSCIICPEHGEFWQTPSDHLMRCGCPTCGIIKKLNRKDRITTEKFIEKAKIIYNNRYDYSKTNYINPQTKVCIICKEHGEFWQVPFSHLSGSNCPKCAIRGGYGYGNGMGGRNCLTLKEFIEKAKQIHGDEYDYSKTKYNKNNEKVCIICKEHGEFWQQANRHLNGCGCSKCKGGVLLDTEEFIKRAKTIHKNRYDYSKVEYVNSSTKVCIICSEHGTFWQEAGNHLQGQGCSSCSQSNLEYSIKNLLEKKGVKYIKEHSFTWLKNEKTNRNLYLDFYLPDYNIAIECQGEQHFKPVRFRGINQEKANKIFEENQVRDRIKLNLCNKHNVKILYYTNLTNIDNIINNENQLINEIIQSPLTT